MPRANTVAVRAISSGPVSSHEPQTDEPSTICIAERRAGSNEMCLSSEGDQGTCDVLLSMCFWKVEYVLCEIEDELCNKLGVYFDSNSSSSVGKL